MFNIQAADRFLLEIQLYDTLTVTLSTQGLCFGHNLPGYPHQKKHKTEFRNNSFISTI